MITPVIPQAGDFAVVNTGSSASRPIEAAQWLYDAVTRKRHGGWEKWDHAVLCVGVNVTASGAPNVTIVEAEPAGARLAAWHYEDRPHQWSTGIITPVGGGHLVPSQSVTRDEIAWNAGRLVSGGTGYGWLDYLALVQHALRIPAPGLKDFIAGTRTMICSQLVDWCYKQSGVQLFNDGRWPGYVTPSDLGALLAADDG